MAEQNSPYLKNLPLTRIKIAIAKVLYKVTTLFFGRKLRVISRNGLFFEVDLSEGIDLSLFIFGNFQSHVTHNSYFKLPSDGIVIDVGANFGIMTLQFAQAAPKGQVYSFEPTHYALARFKRNLALNPELARIIHPINSFVSSETNTNPNITAFSSWKVDGEVAENLHPQHLGAPKPTEGVGSVTLDSFYQQNKLDRIDFIKIDVDGHEYEVLQGAKELMKKFRPVVIFEMSLYLLEENKIEYSVFDTYFKDLNYSLIHSTNGKPITAENYMQIIPAKGTIDILARPL